jgi:hypothetical protein
MILFVDDCIRVDATTLLAKTRGARAGDALVGDWIAEWTQAGPRRRVVRLQITTTPQPFGGVRRWWRCPHCDRRCRILLAPEPDSPLACRRCCDAQYLSAYPYERRRRQRFQLLRDDLSRLTEEERELTFLAAPRRRGVRRGRRLRERADRLSQTLEKSVLQSLARSGAAEQKVQFEANMKAVRSALPKGGNHGSGSGPQTVHGPGSLVSRRPSRPARRVPTIERLITAILGRSRVPHDRERTKSRYAGSSADR